MSLFHIPIRAAAVAGFLLSAACANTAGAVQSAGQASVARALCGLGYSSIQMRALPSGHHVVDVAVNGKPATFVVDTGAGATVIHAPYASTLLAGATGTARGEAIGAGGATALSQFPVTGVSIAGTRTGLTQIFALDLSSVVKALDPLAGKPIQGVVGQDVMRAQNAIVDIQQSRLYLKPVAGETARCS